MSKNLSFTRKEKANFVGIVASQVCMRLCLVLSAALGTVCLTCFSVLFSVMDTPVSVEYLSLASAYIFWWFVSSASGVALLYLVHILHKTEFHTHALDMPYNQLKARDLMGILPSALMMVGVFSIVPLADSGRAGDELKSYEMAKQLVCSSIEHTRASDPNYDFPERYKSLDCFAPEVKDTTVSGS